MWWAIVCALYSTPYQFHNCCTTVPTSPKTALQLQQKGGWPMGHMQNAIEAGFSDVMHHIWAVLPCACMDLGLAHHSGQWKWRVRGKPVTHINAHHLCYVCCATLSFRYVVYLGASHAIIYVLVRLVLQRIPGWLKCGSAGLHQYGLYLTFAWCVCTGIYKLLQWYCMHSIMWHHCLLDSFLLSPRAIGQAALRGYCMKMDASGWQAL